jgi:hypothetical protein
MKTIYIISISLLTLVSTAKASDLEAKVLKALGPAHADCTVNQIFTRMELGGVCYSNEFMVGINSVNPLEVTCTQITVSCPDSHQTKAVAPTED